MPATPARLDPIGAPSAPGARAPGVLGWLAGGLVAGAAALVGVVVAVLVAAALAVVAVLGIVTLLLALAAWRMRGRRGAGPMVIRARWTGYGWDAR